MNIITFVLGTILVVLPAQQAGQPSDIAVMQKAFSTQVECQTSLEAALKDLKSQIPDGSNIVVKSGCNEMKLDRGQVAHN